MPQTSASVEVGRNDSCPCGSGKKFKRCCLDKQEERARQERSAVQAAAGMFEMTLPTTASAAPPSLPARRETASGPAIPRDHLARTMLELYGRRYDGIWCAVDDYRASFASEWPKECFLPVAEAGSVLLGGPEEVRMELQSLDMDQQVQRASILSVMAAWRVTQGIYRIDPTVLAALLDTPVTGNIPVEALLHLPEWCIYVDTPGYTLELVNGERENLLGIWVTIDYDKRTGHHHLLIVGNHEIHGIAAADLPLVGTIEESLASVGRGWQELGAAKAKLAAQSLAPLVSVTLYICDQAGEISDGTRRPRNPQPKRRKSGLRMLPPLRPSTWDVGVRMGAALRAAYAREGSEAEATGRSMRPHIRRAHWHRYRVGPGRTGERARWLPPIAVKVDSIEDLPAVIRPVS